jgi:hypothetical protein
VERQVEGHRRNGFRDRVFQANRGFGNFNPWSDFAVDAKVTGNRVNGTYSEKGGRGKGNFSATIAEDRLSFVADADYWPRVHFTAKKIE